MGIHSNFMKENIEIINQELFRYINELQMPQTLKDAMNYSLQAGGKRIRPLLVLATLDAFQKSIRIGLPVACAVEMVHTYSLIHDDLPAMDDDDFRRGKPTNHKVFGDAMAILAGDALLTYSFQVLSSIPRADISAETKIQLINELAKASGPEGMVAGQVADMEAENKNISFEQLQYIHSHKTGELLTFSVKAGAILAGAESQILHSLEMYAKHIGLAFQIRDDLLDIEGDKEQIGKSVGSDINKHKSTYPSILTKQGAKEKLTDHIKKAKEILEALPINTKELEFLTDLIWEREK